MMLSVFLIGGALTNNAYADTIVNPKTEAQLNEVANYRKAHTNLIKSQETKSESEINSILEKSDNRDPEYLQNYKNALEEKYSEKNIIKEFTKSDDEILNELNSIKIEKDKHQNDILQSKIKNNSGKESLLQSNLTLNVLGAGYSYYNRNATVTYMDNYWNIYNPIYTNHYPDDCCNFVSQVLYAGGVPGSSTWYADSWAWVNNTSFKNYFTGKVYNIIQVSGTELMNNFQYYRSLLWQGDAVQIGGDSPWHIYSVHDFADGDIKMAAHCDNYLHRSLFDVAKSYPDSNFNLYFIKNGY